MIADGKVMNVNSVVMGSMSAYPFSDALHQRILAELEVLMNEEKIYKDPLLSLLNLAHRLRTNTAYLSRIVNDHYQVNFSTWVNRYRIEEAKKMLIVREYTIEKIALLSGFGSKSVFNKAFKNFTGLTPTAWLRKIREEE